MQPRLVLRLHTCGQYIHNENVLYTGNKIYIVKISRVYVQSIIKEIN